MQTTLQVYKGADNPVSAVFYVDLRPLVMQQVNRVVLKLYTLDGDLAATFDTDINSSVMEVGENTNVSPATYNKINFNLNDSELSGMYNATIIIYDPLHTDGQVIAHPNSQYDLLSFIFLDV